MKIDWDSYSKKYESRADESNRGFKPRVGFFSLKNDGDFAIVRIMHDTPQELELIATHKVQLEDGKTRQVSCLRNPSDPIDMCPLCAEDSKLDLGVYLHIIEYVKQEDGTISPVAKVWQKSPSFVQRKISGLMQEYAPLSDNIFKIVRHGAAGSTKTDYEIFPMSEKVYPSNVYVKDNSLFENWSALGTIVLKKTYEEMLNGDYGYKGTSNNTKPVEPTYAPKSEQPYAPKTEPTYASRPNPQPVDDLPWETSPTAPKINSETPVQTASEPQRQPNYYGNGTVNTDTTQRPRRTYFAG